MGEKQGHREGEESHHHIAVLILLSWFGNILLRKFPHSFGIFVFASFYKQLYKSLTQSLGDYELGK